MQTPFNGIVTAYDRLDNIMAGHSPLGKPWESGLAHLYLFKLFGTHDDIDVILLRALPPCWQTQVSAYMNFCGDLSSQFLRLSTKYRCMLLFYRIRSIHH